MTDDSPTNQERGSTSLYIQKTEAFGFKSGFLWKHEQLAFKPASNKVKHSAKTGKASGKSSD